MTMREIEVKAKIDDSDKIIASLENLGCVLSEPIVQNDKIFLENGIEFKDIRKGTNVLRIREQKHKTLFTLKRREENELDCIEKEIEISNAKEFEEILEYLGYHEVVAVNKTRIKCKYDGLEICLDKVDELGGFIEVEKMSDEDGLKVQEELFGFLLSLGIKREDRIFKGYDTLIVEQNKP